MRPYFKNVPSESSLDVVFKWAAESEEHVWEWRLLRDPTTGILYEIASIYCPCCGGPKGLLSPIWDISTWESPYWATPEQVLLFREKLQEALTQRI